MAMLPQAFLFFKFFEGSDPSFLGTRSIFPRPFLCLVLIIIIICFTCWWWKFTKSSTAVINWPLVGMMPGLLLNATRIHEFVTDLLRQNGGTFVFKGPWLCGVDFVLTSNTYNVHHILSKNFGNYGKGPELKQVLEPLGDGILVADGESWKLQRRVVHSFVKENKFGLARERATYQKILNGLFLVLDQASELGTKLDIHDVLRRFMFDIVCQLILDHDPKSLSLGLTELECAKAFTVIEEVTFLRNIVPGIIWKLQRWLQVGKEKELRKAIETFDRFLYGCISSKRDQLARDGSSISNLEDGFNMLTYFMLDENNNEVENEKEKETTRAFINSDKFLRDTACSFVAAGRDSVAAGFSWFLWIVATHQSVEENILKEMREVKQYSHDHQNRSIFDKEELSELVYLQATILETLRLYPPIPFDRLVSMGEDTLPSGHQIFKNTKVVYTPYSMGRMEEIWGEDCLEFKPERWIDTIQGKIKHVASYKFSVFHAGPRTCLGKELALDQMKTVAAAMLWNYGFQVQDDRPVYPANSVILHMKHGLKVRVFKRKNFLSSPDHCSQKS